MKFAIWLENQSVSEDIHSLFLDIISFFDIQEKWMQFANQILKQQVKIGNISVKHAKEDFLSLAAIIKQDKANMPADLWEIPELLDDIDYTLQGHIPKELFNDIRNKLIAERQERINQIFDAINGIADMFDMPPIPEVQDKFRKFSNMVHSSTFWNLSLSLTNRIENIVQDIENDRNVITHLIDLKFTYLPEIFKPGRKLDISLFLDKAKETYESLQS